MKCCFANDCKLYDEDGIVCNVHNGLYYSKDRYAGCYRRKAGKKLLSLVNNKNVGVLRA